MLPPGTQAPGPAEGVSMSVLVTGATGLVGRRVVSGLLDAGEQVRVLTRDPAAAGFDDRVDVVGGDLTGTELPEGLFAGIDRVFVFPALGGVGGFAAAAARGGVERFLLLSSLAA